MPEVQGTGETVKVQCAVCINEIAVIEVLDKIWPDMQEFNRNYCLYQDAARDHKCPDFFPKFQGGS
jgi:hypothetical protein